MPTRSQTLPTLSLLWSLLFKNIVFHNFTGYPPNVFPDPPQFVGVIIQRERTE